jgi:acetyl-CoA carboxylase biotin carboxyl carrier protein
MQQQMPMQQQAPMATPAVTIPVTTAADDSKYVTIKSLMIGTFYRKPLQTRMIFTEVGKTIKKETFMCNGSNEAFQ